MQINSCSLNTSAHTQLVIAVDFDGTIVEHCFPEIGAPIPDAIETLRKLQNDGHRLILWTFRSGRELEEALKYCASRNLYFYAANCNYPNEAFNGNKSRKIAADIFIDDRNVGGLLPWKHVYNLIQTQISKF